MRAGHFQFDLPVNTRNCGIFFEYGRQGRGCRGRSGQGHARPASQAAGPAEAGEESGIEARVRVKARAHGA